MIRYYTIECRCGHMIHVTDADEEAVCRKCNAVWRRRRQVWQLAKYSKAKDGTDE